MNIWLGWKLIAFAVAAYSVWKSMPDDHIGDPRPRGKRLVDSVRVYGMRSNKDHPTKRYTDARVHPGTVEKEK